MQRHWKRYLLLIALVAVLAYVGWRVYQDYQLSAYPQHVADSIPVPPDVRLIEQQQHLIKECRSAGVVRYYATDLSWEQVRAFYRSYLETSQWKPLVVDQAYIWNQSPRNQRLQLTLGQIKNAQNDVEQQIISSGKMAYIVQIDYNQDIAAWERYCKPED